MTNIREVTEADFPAIDVLIHQRIWERANKKWTQFIDPAKVEDVLKNRHPTIHSVVVEETYLLVFSIVHMWFSNTFFVEEKLVIKPFKGTGKFSDVTKALEHIAKVSEASGILSGTLMAPHDKALARMYNRAGYDNINIGLLKVMK